MAAMTSVRKLLHCGHKVTGQGKTVDPQQTASEEHVVAYAMAETFVSHHPAVEGFDSVGISRGSSSSSRMGVTAAAIYIHAKACLSTGDSVTCEARTRHVRKPASFALAVVGGHESVVSVKHFLRVQPPAAAAQRTPAQTAALALRLAVCQAYPFTVADNDYLEVSTADSFLVNNGELQVIALEDFIAPLVCATYRGGAAGSLEGDLLRLTRSGNCSSL
jgi:hypothetical protein